MAPDNQGRPAADSEHLRALFSSSRHPMLIVDDWRRWVTGNSAACDLLGVAPEDIAWHTLDDFTADADRTKLDEQWAQFLAGGAVEGWIELAGANRGAIQVEFSAAANWLPARHLAVFISPESPSADSGEIPDRSIWTPANIEAKRHVRLTKREREVMTMVAAGYHTTELAERLYLSPETIKSHVQNAMRKFDAHTRAHAVAIALVSGQISVKGEGPTA